MQCSDAVSYTHLDVYKRQTTVCAVFTTEASETYAVTLEKEGEGKVDITGADEDVYKRQPSKRP